MKEDTIDNKYKVVDAVQDNCSDHFMGLGEIQYVVHLVHGSQSRARSRAKL